MTALSISNPRGNLTPFKTVILEQSGEREETKEINGLF